MPKYTKKRLIGHLFRMINSEMISKEPRINYDFLLWVESVSVFSENTAIINIKNQIKAFRLSDIVTDCRYLLEPMIGNTDIIDDIPFVSLFSFYAFHQIFIQDFLHGYYVWN